MKKIIEMREKMAALATEARAELDKVTDKTEASRVKEIEARFDAIMSDHDKLAADVEREERMQAAEKKAIEARRPVPAEEAKAAAEESRSKPEYREVFEKQLRHGVASLDVEERQVLATGRDVESRAQATNPDSAGGYTVPEELAGTVDKQLAIWGPMWDADIVTELVTSTGAPFRMPTTNDTTKTGSIKAENAAATDDGSADVVFSESVLNAYMYDTGIVRVPLELLQDSEFNMESLMAELFSERLGRAANAALTTGTGTNQPNGIATQAQTGITAAGAAAITSDEVIDLMHSVDAAYRMNPKCRWMFSDSVLNYLRKLKDGQGNYLWQMGDVRTGEPDTLLGKPYSINQAMASIATGNKSILFGDMSKYYVRKVRAFTMLTLRERYAENLQVGLIAFKRFDGELIQPSAVKALVQA